MSILKQGAEWLESQRVAYLSDSVTYTHDGTPSTVNATYGKTGAEQSDESGFTIQALVWDFLIAVSELSAEPEPGDTITADGRVFEVTALGSEKCWRYSDNYRNAYRIHTNDIGDE